MPVEAAQPRVMQFIPQTKCWICGGESFKPVFDCKFDLSGLADLFGDRAIGHQPSVDLVKCLSCGFAQPASLPADDDYFALLYQQKWSPAQLSGYFDFGDKDFIFSGVLKDLAARHDASLPKTLLDVGTYVGRFVWLARAAGWDAEGLETNEAAVAVAREKTGATIHRGTAETLAMADRRYAAVVFTDVLEHIPRPLPIVESLRKLVMPRGWIAIKVPHGPAQRIKEHLRGAMKGKNVGVATNLVHVNHFTPHSLKLCLEKAGFVNVTIKTGAPEFPPPAHRKHWSQHISVLSRKTSFALCRGLPGGVYLPFSFNLQAYAQNP